MRWNLSKKLIVILILVALVPISLFGLLAIWTSRETTYRSVAEGNLNVAIRAAEQIDLYVDNSLTILEALAQNLSKSDLAVWQKQRMITNYVVNFDEFEEIYLTDRLGKQIATSELGVELQDRSQITAIQKALSGQIYRSRVFISDNLVPSIQIAIPLRFLNKIEGSLFGEINLISMWSLVDSIRIGQNGYAFVVSKKGQLIAHGAPDKKDRVLKQEMMDHLPIVASAINGGQEILVYTDDDGTRKIGVSVHIQSLGWTIIIEQPTQEAFAAANQMIFHLAFLIIFFLVVAILIGTIAGRKQILSPIQELSRVTKKIGDGILTEKVKILTQDEFQELGSTFNLMTEKLIEFQDEIRKNERSVIMGRIASGLVHDLRHPVHNIENNARLLLKNPEDPRYVEVFKKTVQREFENINRFLDGLRQLTHPIPIHAVRMDLHRSLNELIEILGADPRYHISEKGSLNPSSSNGHSTNIIKDFSNVELKIIADRFALERVFKNLITNAIEAMPNGGRLVIHTHGPDADQRVSISFSDTGCGIHPDRLKEIFSDFITTKRKGLGLGLAVTKKIVDELKGNIKVKSIIHHGTQFTLTLPAA